MSGLTSDGRAVLCHDPTPERLTGCRRPVAACSLGELQSLDFEHHAGRADVRFQSLEQALEQFAAVPFFVEMKSDGVGDDEAALRALARETARCAQAAPGVVYFLSFDDRLLRAAREFRARGAVWPKHGNRGAARL